jgi:dTDP-4-dehydrorhamnose 3,5-epimerase
VKVAQLKIPDVCIIDLNKSEDDRGFFSEVFNQRSLASAGLTHVWVQDNHALSKRARTVRGLHFQRPPRSQAKLVRVSRGSIFDVAVDIRKGSPFFGEWIAAIISEKSWNAILVPEGFAHGYLTLEDNCEVQYKVNDYHAPECEAGIAWDDPDLAIDWPVGGLEPYVSAKDKTLPRFAEVDSPFSYGER